MRWFKHDCMARNDPRLMVLLARHGCEGLCLYWILLEETGKLSNTLHLKISGLSTDADSSFNKLQKPEQFLRDPWQYSRHPKEIPVYPAEILAKSVNTKLEKLRYVIATCVDIGLFDETKWIGHNVLYCPGFASLADPYTRAMNKRSSPNGESRLMRTHETRTESDSEEESEWIGTLPVSAVRPVQEVPTTEQTLHRPEQNLFARTEADTEAEEERDENSRTEQKQNGDAEAEAGPELQASGKFSTPYPHSSRLESNLSLGIEPERIGEYGENCRVIVDEWNRTHSNNFKWEITGSELKTLILGGERHLKVWVCTEGMNLTGGERSYPSLLYRAVRLMLRASEKSRIMNQSRWLWACLNGSEGSPPWVHQQTVEEESSNPRRNGGSVKVLREILAGADN